MKDELDNFLEGGENKVVTDPLETKVEDPFAKTGESKVEETTEEVKEEKPLPFHKDPKVQRYIQKEVEKLTRDIKPNVIAGVTSVDEADEILTRIIGNDTPEKVSAIKDFKKYLSGLEEKGAQKALSTIQEERQREVQEEEKAVEELNQGFDGIEETFGVDITSNTPQAKKTRNDFVDFINRVSPKDEYGQVVQLPDLENTFALFQEMNQNKKPSTNRAKELASKSMARSTDASNAPTTTDNSWKAVEKAFSKIR
jgi:hypothetical protein